MQSRTTSKETRDNVKRFGLLFGNNKLAQEKTYLMKATKRFLSRLSVNVYLMFFLTIFFILSLVIIVRWSDLPLVVNVFPLSLIFLREPDETVDSAILSVLSGYATGYMVFIATAYLPSSIRNKPMRAIAYKEMQLFVYESNYLLLSMCKAVNDNAESLSSSYSTDCYVLSSEKVIRDISSLNLLSDSEFPLTNAETPRDTLTWLDLVTMQFEQMYCDIEKTMLLYHLYLPNRDIRLLEDILSNHLLGIVVGKDCDVQIEATGKDGNRYFLCKVQLRDFVGANRQSDCTFNNILDETNALLVDFAQLLAKVSSRLEKKLPDFDSRFAIKGVFVGNCKSN